MEKKVLHEFQSKTGLTRVSQDTKGNIKIDSYFGDVRDPQNHDRVSLNATTGRFSGHGFDHKDKFDSNKTSKKSK